MPRATLSLRRVESFAGRSLPTAGWAEALFPTKAEFAEIHPPDELVVESTPDRLDLLCDAGLGSALAGLLGGGVGAPPLLAGPSPVVGSIRVDASVAPLRPAIAAFELTAPAGGGVDDGLLGEAIRFQELLHGTVGLDRRLVSFGLYAVDRLTGPIDYRAEPADAVRFVPLGETGTTDGERFYAAHPMAARYGKLGRSPAGILVLRDAAGAVLSLPPVLNAEGPGSVRVGDRRLLLEATGTRPARLADGLGLLLLPFVAAGWSVTTVPVEGAVGTSGAAPRSATRTLRLRSELLRSVLGAALAAGEVTTMLGRARLDARPVDGGWEVDVPPWRPDLLADVDLVEEVVVQRGVRLEEGLLLPSATRGRRRPESWFRDAVGDLLLGAGFVPLHLPVLVPADRNARIGRTDAFRLAYPVSEELAVLRDRLLPGLVGALARNTRHPYPQRLSEIGPVVEPDGRAETGGRTVWRAGFLLAGEGLGFALAAARIDALLRAFGARGVREPAELPGAIAGRAAIVRIAGDTVAELGELRPELLVAERVPVPVAFGEIDLSALWPLVRAHETL